MKTFGFGNILKENRQVCFHEISRMPAKTWGSAYDWKSIQPDEVKGDVALKYYRIDNVTSVIDEPNAARMAFWDNLPLNEFEDEMSVYSRRDDGEGTEDYDN